MTLSPFRSAIREPTLKQKEAYGRFFHTLAAACAIGFATLVWTATPPLDKLGVLLFLGVVLFFLGAILSKGE